MLCLSVSANARHHFLLRSSILCHPYPAPPSSALSGRPGLPGVPDLYSEHLAPCLMVPFPKGTRPPAIPQVLQLEAVWVPRPAEHWWPASAAGPPFPVAQGLGVSCPAWVALEQHLGDSPLPCLLLLPPMPPKAPQGPTLRRDPPEMPLLHTGHLVSHRPSSLHCCLADNRGQGGGNGGFGKE